MADTNTTTVNVDETPPPKEETTPVAEKPVDQVDPKPKRQLTEAQRLAFLKGREKRQANLERKRQEKEEATAAVAAPKTDNPTTPPARPPTPLPAKPVAHFDPDEYASAIVDRLYKRLSEEEQIGSPAEATACKPKRQRKPRTVPSAAVTSHPTPPAPKEVAPQRVFHWC